MPDGRKTNGGPRPNAGRPSDNEVHQLRTALKKACPDEQREAILQALALKASKGDITAAKLILAYAYGTPPSGDDLAVEERVNAIANEFFLRLTQVYGEAKAREIIGHLGAHAPGTGPSKSRAATA